MYLLSSMPVFALLKTYDYDQTTDLIRNWKVLKDLKNQVSQMKSLLRAPKDLRCLQPVDICCIGKRSTVLTGPSFVM